MPNSPDRNLSKRGLLLAGGLLVCATTSCLAADVETDTRAAAFLAEILSNSAAALPEGGAGCLSQNSGATFGREVAAILNGFADSAENIVLTSKCEAEGEGGEHCTLSLSVTEGEEQASAGLSFSLRKAGNGIDLGSARCFQTP